MSNENIDNFVKLRACLRENVLKSSIHIKKNYGTWLLMKIGLSPTEAIIYLELLKGSSTPAQISKKLNITINDSSTLLKRLFNKGFVVRKRDGKTYSYSPIRPEKLSKIVESVYNEVGKILKNELEGLRR